MFDTIVRPRGDSSHYHNHNSEVTINRAPTDKSVELLMEMEKAARDKILATIPIRNSSFECAIIVRSAYTCSTIGYVFDVSFTLNGRTYTPSFLVERTERMCDLRREREIMSEKLIEQMGKYISKIVLSETLKSFVDNPVFGEIS